MAFFIIDHPVLVFLGHGMIMAYVRTSFLKNGQITPFFLWYSITAVRTLDPLVGVRFYGLLITFDHPR